MPAGQAAVRWTMPTKLGKFASSCNQLSRLSKTSNMGSFTAESPNGRPVTTSGARQTFS